MTLVLINWPCHMLALLKKRTIEIVETRPSQASPGWKNAKWLALLERLYFS